MKLCPYCYNPIEDVDVDYLKADVDHLKAENAKLRELADTSYTFAFNCYHGVFDQEAFFKLREKYYDSGIEVDE